MSNKNYTPRYRQRTPKDTDVKQNPLIIRILGVIILLLCLIAIYRISADGSIPTFTDFIKTLTQVPTISIPSYGTSLSAILNESAWGAFDFFRVILINLSTVLDFLIYLVNLLIQLVTMLIYFIRWIFTF